MYFYEKLEKRLADKGITRTNLARETGISSRTIAKISKGEKQHPVGRTDKADL